ncbi:SET domain-containing protein [Heliocybe sulcata]|uniref:SET domain-containing protein n=1 Tax=Heliocybe sulcata TaxID=5364 RepID=A0A5C3MQT6_9AGAM|nr:SET domain-containing protein [Heliocybe sulcata]
MEQGKDLLEPDNITAFRKWLLGNGAKIHPTVYFESHTWGFSVRTRVALQPDTTIVSAPFSFAITAELAGDALEDILGAALRELSERELICTYICMHWVIGEQSLRHFPYLNTLPSPPKLRTPLHFTDNELQAFKGTNLYGATLDRKRQWEAEWQRCRDLIKPINEQWAADLTWDRYLAASTYLSSRAFPSSILSRSPTLSATPSSYPVLLPGIDALNHSRAQPVSWLVTYPDSGSASEEPSISLVLHSAQDAGSELFNNYGPKPNSELILGYGFSLKRNPDDTIVLQLGGTEKKWEVGRDARGLEGVWEQVLHAVQGPEGSSDDGGVESDWQDEMEAANVLQEMTQALLDRLPPFPPAGAVREEIKVMLDHYLEGQRAILRSILEFALDKEGAVIRKAREAGIEIVDDDIQNEESDPL